MRTSIRRLAWAGLLCATVGSAAFAEDTISISGAITTSVDGLPVPGAVVTIVGAEATATSEPGGRYVLQAPRSIVRDGRMQLKVDALGLPPRIVDVAVTAGTLTVDVALELNFSEQITVGSRVPGAGAEKAVPVDIITRDQLTSSGYTETAQLIESLSVRQLHRGTDRGAAQAVRRQRRALLTNAIDTRTDGVEVTANYRIDLQAAGDLRLRAGYSHAVTEIVGSVATPPQLAGFESVLFDRIERRRIECGQPNDNARLGADWRRRRLGANVNMARYGSFCSFTLSPADDHEYGAKWLTDAEASFRASGYTLAVGVENLFDLFPDRNTTVNSFNGIQTFPSHSPFGMNGRTIYARVGRTF
ncbi:MAG: TonB-dependent receptor [Vicinamibacterales bacterium]